MADNDFTVYIQPASISLENHTAKNYGKSNGVKLRDLKNSWKQLKGRLNWSSLEIKSIDMNAHTVEQFSLRI